MKKVKREDLKRGKKYWIQAEFLDDDGGTNCPLYFDFEERRLWFGEDINIALLEVGKAEEAPRYIDKPQKQKVPQVAVEFYEQYKDDGLDLGEWFSDFYSNEAIEQFPRIEELAEWLHDNDNETNRQREFALATLVTLGIDAVEVEKEKLYTVEIPNPKRKGKKKVMLIKDAYGDIILGKRKESVGKNNRLTEAEIKQDFAWAWQWAKPVDGEIK